MKAREYFRQAIRQATHTRAGVLPTLFQVRGHTIGEDQRADCPFCESPKSLLFSQDEDAAWRCSCQNLKCRAAGWLDEVAFIALHDELTETEAIRKLLDASGLSHLWTEIDETQADHEDEFNTPKFIQLPDIGRNPYEEAWSLLTLTDEHRAETREKRGMPDSWQEAFGLKSAIPANRELLTPILDKFPPNVLLRSGIAVRDRKTNDLRIADSLCGRFFDDDDKRWVTQPTIIIPYITEDGRIELLRPHKKSLSNSRWREQEEVADHYEKLHNNLRIPYGKHLLGMPRAETWKHHAVIGEGEFKGMALAICGVPGLYFQGIHYFLQNRSHRQAITDTVECLRNADVRMTLVVFDNEDKSHKPFHERFETETFARFTAECLEDSGFTSLWGNLPDHWRENNKADWDSRLAYHVRERGINDGIDAAKDEFLQFLERRHGKDATMRPSPRQLQFEAGTFQPDPKEDVIQQALHRLRYEPDIFVGGKTELSIASEIENWCHAKYAHRLKVKKIAQELRKCFGGYYIIKPPSEDMEKRAIAALDDINENIAALEGDPNADENELRRYRAAKQAAYTILYKLPKSFTDFTAISKYKILAYDDKGEPRLDRLITFIDANGRRSRAYQMPADRMSSSQELRKFFISMGGYHWSGNQDECDKWVRHIDIENHQREITEIDTYGWNKDHKLYLFLDCAIADGKGEEPGTFLFPKKDGIVWHQGRGFRNSDVMANFSHTPPSLFPGAKDPRAAFNDIDWEQEKRDAQPIWKAAISDFKASFGGYAGYALVAGILQYLTHPEAKPAFGKPSISIQGEKGSGKTKTTGFGMRLLGFHSYDPISLGSTKVGIERAFTRFCGLPLHIDEWRNDKIDSRMLDLFISAYNELTQHKGTPQGGKLTRAMTPMTPAITTGEDSAVDSALRSRYIRIIAAPHYGQQIPENETESQRAARDQAREIERNQRFDRMMRDSDDYHRIGRLIIRERKKFSRIALEFMRAFKSNPKVIDRISTSRARENIGLFVGAIAAAYEILHGHSPLSLATDHPDFVEFRAMNEWFINHGEESNTEIEKDVFRNRFFSECVTMISRKSIPGTEKYIRVLRVQMDGSHKDGFKITPIPDGLMTNTGRLVVVIRPSELFSDYQVDRRRREGSGSPIAQSNIQGELKSQTYWIKPSKKEREHRFRIPKDGSHRGLWVLDWKSMDEDLRSIFIPIYEAELAPHDMVVAQDGETAEGIHATTQQIPF